jgi:hypothetical protein
MMHGCRNGKGSTIFLWFTFIAHAPWSCRSRPWADVRQGYRGRRSTSARVVQHGSCTAETKTKRRWRAEVYSRNIVWRGEAMIVSHLPTYMQDPFPVQLLPACFAFGWTLFTQTRGIELHQQRTACKLRDRKAHGSRQNLSYFILYFSKDKVT